MTKPIMSTVLALLCSGIATIYPEALSYDCCAQQFIRLNEECAYTAAELFNNDCVDSTMSDEELRSLLPNLIDEEHEDAHFHDVASVRKSTRISPGEMRFRQKRLSLTKKALEKVLKRPLKKAYQVAFCFSGGGYRAMIGGLGTLVAAEKVGLLDAATYVSGLSGSTWLLGSWMMRGKKASDVCTPLQKSAAKKITADFDLKYIIARAMQRITFKQYLNLVAVYGSMIANRIFDDIPREKKQNYRLSDQAEIIRDGTLPMPIYTAVIPRNDDYYWVEFNPFEVYIINEALGIPSWAFGRKFNAGASVKYAPEYPFDFELGIFGSAFTASLEELIRYSSKAIPSIIYEPLDHITKDTEAGEVRFVPARVRNFTQNIDSSLLAQEDYITMVDAGLDINLPMAPLLRRDRDIDIIFVVDNSADVNGAPELKKVENYARKNCLPFPEIDYSFVNKKPVTIFQDYDDPSIPLVIYLPLTKNPRFSKTFDPITSINGGGFCGTFNLQYTQSQFAQLFSLSEFNFLEYQNYIINGINDYLDRREKA